MQHAAIQRIRNGLNYPNAMGAEVPEIAVEAYADLLGLLRYMTNKCLPQTCSPQDLEDAEADALLRGVSYIRRIMATHREIALSWDKQEWRNRLYSRFHDGVLESSRYLIFPFSLPRPVRFSLKKYSDVMKILRRYSSTTDLKTSIFYRAIVVHRCSIRTMGSCKVCKFRRPHCPIQAISRRDLKKLYEMVAAKRHSLTYYAHYYRTSYATWINMLESISSFSFGRVDKESTAAAHYNMEEALTLSRLQQRMDAEDPRLYKIYCDAIAHVNVDQLNEDLVVQLPRGWITKSIKDHYELSSEELQSLLEAGDRVLNEFRGLSGLAPITRPKYFAPMILQRPGDNECNY